MIIRISKLRDLSKNGDERINIYETDTVIDDTVYPHIYLKVDEYTDDYSCSGCYFNENDNTEEICDFVNCEDIIFVRGVSKDYKDSCIIDRKKLIVIKNVNMDHMVSLKDISNVLCNPDLCIYYGGDSCFVKNNDDNSSELCMIRSIINNIK